MPRILMLCTQGGLREANLNAAIGRELYRVAQGRLSIGVAALRQVDADEIRKLTPEVDVLASFEQFRRDNAVCDVDAEVQRIARDYADVNWWAVIASERSFIDASFLVGGLGQRTESQDYAQALVVHLVRYFESILGATQFSAVVCPLVDTLFTHVFYQVVRQHGIRILGRTHNAWIREDDRPGFFIIRDEFLHCDRMEEAYRRLRQRGMNEQERARVRRYKQIVADFDVDDAFRTIMKRPYIVPALSPKLKILHRYMRENAARRKEVEYYKIDVAAKAMANVRRAFRRWQSKRLLGPKSSDVPARSVFYPMQYQPEQTTLVGGVFFANQVAVIENIAKSLPFGYTLIVKEHPRGRGARPAWQYRHLAHFPNIQFRDGDSKQILRNCDAAITITGTIGLEAMALDKPIVVLGNCYYDFAEVVYHPKSWPELARAFRRILIDREYENNKERQDQIDCFFWAYLDARMPVQLVKESAPGIADAIYAEFKNSQKAAQTDRSLQDA